MPSFISIDGILTKKLQFGFADDAPSLEFDDENNLSFPDTINVKASKAPSNDEDLANMKYVRESAEGVYTDMKTYVDAKITGDSTGETVVGSSTRFVQTISAQSIVLGVTEITTLSADDFIDRIVLEFREAFSIASKSKYYVSVGTYSKPSLYLQSHELTAMDSSVAVDIFSTVSSASLIIMTITEEVYVEPTYEIEDILENPHEDITMSMTTDNSGLIRTIAFGGTDIADDSVEYHDADDYDLNEGPFADFMVKIPVALLPDTTNIKLVETNYGLAAINNDGDISYSQSSGFTRTTTQILDTSADTLNYPLMMTASSGSSDYSHLYIYDMDSDTPNTAVMVFHFRNQLNFASGGMVNISSLDVEFADNDACVYVYRETDGDGAYELDTRGDVTPVMNYPDFWNGISGNYVELVLVFPDIPNDDTIFTVTQSNNPALEYFADDEYVSEADGIYTKTRTYSGSDFYDGFIMLVGDVIDDDPIEVTVEDADGSVWHHCLINNAFSFVESHTYDTVVATAETDDTVDDETVEVIDSSNDTGSVYLHMVIL